MPLPGLAQEEAGLEISAVELAGEATLQESAGFAETVATDASGERELDGLLRELATASLAESVRLLPRLEAEGGLAMLSGVDEDSVVLLREALQQEEDSAVRELLDLGIALFTVNTTQDEAEALQALSHMEGRLEAPVRNTLVRLIENRADDMPQLAESASRVLRGIEGDIRFYQRIEQLFFGLSLGSVLLLAATGLAVTFGVMGVINMAHGEMLMLGAYTTYVVQLLMPSHINLSIWVALPAAFLVTALVGVCIQRFVIRYLSGRPLETLPIRCCR